MTMKHKGGTSNLEECITHGPWVGAHGKAWTYMPQTSIKTIRIIYGKLIDCLIFQNDSHTGESQTSIFGGNGGNKTSMICINYPNEYLTSISGTIDFYTSSAVLMSLCFHTNQKGYGPYGTCDTGSRFSYGADKDCMVVGFHGRVGQCINAIGIYSMPKSLAFNRNSTNSNREMSLTAMPRDAGPWGASGAKPWDDGVFCDIKQIRVHVGKSLKVIHAIQFEYVKRDGESILSQIHGGKGGEKTEVVDLDYPGEYLTGISGYYGNVDGYSGLEAIMAVTFHTNKGIYGPYGHENGAGMFHLPSSSHSLGIHLKQADTSILEKCITFGPWGSSEGKEWIYIPEGFIKKIRISHGPDINSIEFHSECSEGETRKSLFGVEGGIRTDTIIIDHPDEYITSISGTISYRLKVVKSLYFQTNQHRYGPYGRQVEDSGDFSYGGKGSVIVGFHGCFGKQIESIGLYVMPKSLATDQNPTFVEKCITLGPWGSYFSQGKEWNYVPEGFIKKICISHGFIINGIEFQSYSSEGASQKSCFGYLFGSKNDMVCINHPDEYLMSISGSFGHSSRSIGVTSLCFHTNQNCYGLYGSGEGNYGHFSYDGKGGVLVGFHGRCDTFIQSIGFYVMPKSLAMDQNSATEEYSRPEKCCRMAKLEMPRDVGPWGASGGKAWDDGVFCNIKQIRVHLGYPSKVLFGIQLKYVKKNGDLILSRLHGGSDGDVSEVEINLDGVEEYLTGISGFYGPVEEFNGVEGVTSITFNTNKGKYGPFGHESGGAEFVSFASSTSSGKVVGFHDANLLSRIVAVNVKKGCSH
ncbi:hypothetical protein LXL04_031597 [Taraxacum kok-saghyz]